MEAKRPQAGLQILKQQCSPGEGGTVARTQQTEGFKSWKFGVYKRQMILSVVSGSVRGCITHAVGISRFHGKFQSSDAPGVPLKSIRVWGQGC